MRRVRIILLPVLLVLAWIACKERFDPKIPSTQSNLLVVDGIINAKGFTTVRLSRTVPLKDPANIKPELNALITIRGEDNSIYNVRAKGNGVYMSDSLILKSTQKYRLHIKTSSGGEYLSEYAPVKQTPVIDSIPWKLEDNAAVQIYVNAHDAGNNSRYYKWEYEETWEIHSMYQNNYIYKNGVVSDRPFDQIDKLYYCWRSVNSSNTLLGSTAQLTNDVVSLAPITFIPPHSERIGVRYSILIRQFAIDQKAYEFFKQMKNNTESLGSIFDRLPSETTGNIACVSNPSEKVIGFITASTVEEKRIFITRGQVPSRYSLYCESIYVANNRDSFKVYYDSGGLLPYQADGTPGPIKGYYSSYPECIDCTIRGTNVKPSFW